MGPTDLCPIILGFKIYLTYHILDPIFFDLTLFFVMFRDDPVLPPESFATRTAEDVTNTKENAATKKNKG